MCGRFTLTADAEQLMALFQLSFFPEEYVPRFNISPSQQVLSAVKAAEGYKAGYLKWGLVPFWVKDAKKWKPLINARAESLEEKASFKHLLDKRRCIIFADGYYEWKEEGGKKRPYRIVKQDGKPFAFAGLWDKNDGEAGGLPTCTIITVPANGELGEIHDRMPAIFTVREEIAAWLDKSKPFPEVRPLLKTAPENLFYAYEVSPAVNSPKNESEACIRPAEEE